MSYNRHGIDAELWFENQDKHQTVSVAALLVRQSLRNYQEALKYHHNRLSKARIEFYRGFKSPVDRETPPYSYKSVWMKLEPSGIRR